jgi:hypothetical protein
MEFVVVVVGVVFGLRFASSSKTIHIILEYGTPVMLILVYI